MLQKIIVLITIISSYVCANNIDSYVNKAISLDLSNNKEWLRLLHYENGVSQIDDMGFFYAKNGNKNSEQELIETIKNFYKPLEIVTNIKRKVTIREISKNPNDRHAICRFPARFDFLNSHLHFQNLPKIDCEEYNNMLNYINPQSITIVFPAAHINSPASMFGHTFLVFDSSYNSKLLSHSINYAANVDINNEDGITYAFKGIFGLYKGYYSILPYYDSLKEYRDSDNRDIWEFKLKLTKEETIKAYNHMWELRDIYSNYYFFDENCSYNILWLLEVAKDIDLRDKFTYQVIPLETIFILKKYNLIEKETYRPSKRRIIKEYEKLFTKNEIEHIKEIKNNKLYIPYFENKEKEKLFLELALHMSEYYLQKNKIDAEMYKKIVHKLAQKRSLQKTSIDITPTPKESPLKSHRAVRISSSFVSEYKNKKRDNRTTLELRFAYHDLTDSTIGQLNGTQIEFLKTKLSFNDKNSRIDNITLLSLASITPITPLFNPISYRAEIGASRIFDNISPYIQFGAGFAKEIFNTYLYYLLEPVIMYDKKTIVGISNNIGTILFDQSIYKGFIQYSNTLYSNSIVNNKIKATLSANINQNISLFTSYDKNIYTGFYDKHRDSIEIGFRIYF